jgi:NAD(P)-dependent dehydrogenase (short-subunit alcohol dehydrogenase family)
MIPKGLPPTAAWCQVSHWSQRSTAASGARAAHTAPLSGREACVIGRSPAPGRRRLRPRCVRRALAGARGMEGSDQVIKHTAATFAAAMLGSSPRALMASNTHPGSTGPVHNRGAMLKVRSTSAVTPATRDPEPSVQDYNLNLTYDRVVVTGGGSGIGRQVALALARHGTTVYVMGRRFEALAETARSADGMPGRVVPVQTDVTAPERLHDAFNAVEADGGAVQALVHCAAELEYRPARDLTPEMFHRVVTSILSGTFNAVHRWATPLIDSGADGVAIGVTSMTAAQGTPGAAHSSASKAGVEALFRTLAREWGPYSLRLNILGPGFIPVERTQDMWKDAASKPVIDLIALGRTGTLREVVEPVLFMLSDGASYMTGEVLVVDGGFRLSPHVLPRMRFRAEP